jgi:hypothetical protein
VEAPWSFRKKIGPVQEHGDLDVIGIKFIGLTVVQGHVTRPLHRVEDFGLDGQYVAEVEGQEDAARESHLRRMSGRIAAFPYAFWQMEAVLANHLSCWWLKTAVFSSLDAL